MEIGVNQIMSISEILVDFDFNKVAKTMEATNWKWELPKILNDDPGENPPNDMMTKRAPTEVEMRRTVFRLLMEAITKEESCYEGGFEVKFSWDNPEKTSFSIALQFVAEDIEISSHI